MVQKSSCHMTKKTGFTLVELLIVITIIGILMSLVMPAVNSARETARQMTCKTHLMNLSRGMLTHNTANNGRFPTGGEDYRHIGDVNRGTAGQIGGVTSAAQRGGWPFCIADFVGIGNVKNAGLLERCKTPVPFFYCPSRRKPELYRSLTREVIGDDQQGNNPYLTSKTDYAANSGDIGSPEVDHDSCYNSGGVIFTFSTIYDHDVTDGLSKTCLLGEKHLNINVSRDQSVDDGGDDDCFLAGRNFDSLRVSGDAKTIYRDREGWEGVTYFGSAHPTGIHMVFCDGHLAKLNYTIDPTILSRLTNRKDGYSVSESDVKPIK